MRMLFVAAALVCSSLNAWAYPGWDGPKGEMWSSDIIAEVTIWRAQEPASYEAPADYQANARVFDYQVWKGNPSTGKLFAAAPALLSLRRGSYLLFLQRKNDSLRLHTVLRITGDSVEWMQDDDKFLHEQRSLDEVRAEIQTRIQANQSLQRRARTLRENRLARKQRIVSSALWLRGEKPASQWPSSFQSTLNSLEGRVVFGHFLMRPRSLPFTRPFQPQPRRDALLSRIRQTWE